MHESKTINKTINKKKDAKTMNGHHKCALKYMIKGISFLYCFPVNSIHNKMFERIRLLFTV